MAYQSRMGLTIVANNDLIYSTDQIDEEKLSFEFLVDLPLTLTFKVDGKNIGDTEVDAQGNIVRDKCVILNALSINGIWVKRWMLENKLIEFTDSNGEKTVHNYFGKNGTARFTIPYSDLLEFWLDTMTVDQ